MFQGQPGFFRMTLAAVAGVSCLTAAACGSSASSGTASDASAPSTADPLANLSAAQVQAETIANAKAASSLTLKGTLSQSGQDYMLNLAIKPGHGCVGTISEGSKGSFKLIVIGKTVYLNPDNNFWKTYAGSSAAAAIALVNGRYIKTSTSDSNMVSVASLCDVSQLFSAGSTGPLTKGTVTTLGGVRVLPLHSSHGVAYVTDTSKPELVELSAPKSSKGESGVVTVTTGTPVTLAAPPASQVIEGSKIGI